MTPATLSDDQALELLLKPPAAPRETPDIDGFLSDNQALDLLLEGPGKVEEDKDVSPISTAVRSFGAGAAGVVGSIPKSVGIAAHQIDRALGRGPEGEGWPQEEYTTYRVGKAIEGLVSPPEPDEGGFLSKTLPGGAGSMVAFVAGGVAGKAAKLPALAITAALGSSATGAILYEEALAKGSSEDEALGAWIAGSTLGLTEAVPITRALGRADKATGGGLKRLLASGFKGGSEEALQELIQGAGSDKIRVEILGEDAPDNVLGYFTDKDTVEGSGAGFILGTGLSMAASAIGGRAARSSRTRTPPPEVAPEPESAPEAGPTPEVVAEPAPVPTPEAVAPEPVNLSDQEAIDLLLGEEAAPEAIPEGTPAPELPPVEGPVGKETVLHSPAGELRARYRLTEAGTLQPSHNPTTFEKNPNYPAGVQERAYHDNKNAQAEVINVSQNFKEELVINTDPTAINGPPQATSTGVVVGGNQRDMATQRMYLDGKGDNYRKYLEEHAEEYGLTKEQVRSLKNPELFREILDAPTDTEGLRVLGRDLNRSFTKALSEMEEAVSAGKNLSVETANSIGERLEQMGDKATLRSMMTKDPMVFRDAMLRDGVMRESDLPKYFTNEGALNSVGKDFVENAMVGSAVRDVDLLQSLPKNLVAKFERVVPQMLELGKRSDTWNIMEDVREAARQVSSAQIRGIKLEDQLQNKTMFGEGPTAKVQAIARALAKKPTEVAAIFKNFSKEARSDVENQVTMFGAADPIEAFDRIFGADSTAVPKSSEAAMRPGEGAYAHAGGRPILPSLKKLFQKEMPKDLVRRSEILEKLSKELGGIPIRLGRISTKKALGIYKVKPEVIRLRQANDISVAMHEAGHHINKLMFPGEGGKLNWGPLEKFEAELDAIATPSKERGVFPSRRVCGVCSAVRHQSWGSDRQGSPVPPGV